MKKRLRMNLKQRKFKKEGKKERNVKKMLIGYFIFVQIYYKYK